MVKIDIRYKKRLGEDIRTLTNTLVYSTAHTRFHYKDPDERTFFYEDVEPTVLQSGLFSINIVFLRSITEYEELDSKLQTRDDYMDYVHDYLIKKLRVRLEFMWLLEIEKKDDPKMKERLLPVEFNFVEIVENA